MVSVYDLTLPSNINHRVYYKKESEKIILCPEKEGILN